MKTSIPQPDRCIACTTCTVFCPVAGATADFPGPRMIGPAHERFRLAGFGEDESLQYCSNCKNCDISCPCDVPVSTFIMRARADQCRERRPALRDWVLAHGELLARGLRLIPARLKNFGLSFGPARAVLHALGIARKAPVPGFAPKTFRERCKALPRTRELPRKIVLFPGCYVDIYDPESGLDMVAVLNKAGFEAVVPDDFVCCGLPLVANGFWEDARENARRNLKALSRWKAEGYPVLTACPSCALMFKEDYAQYFPELLPRGLSPTLADACEFLLEAMERGELDFSESGPESGPKSGSGAGLTANPGKGGEKEQVLYHAPCHMRAQGIGLPGLALLREIPGLEPLNADAGCCGISGSYGFKSEKYPVAMRVGEKLFAAIRRSPARICASECGTCRVQMLHGGGKKTVHPITILRRALDGARIDGE